MLGVKQSTDKESKGDEGSDVIKKKNTIKRKEEKKEKQREKSKEKVKELSLMDREKALFTVHKSKYNILKTNGQAKTAEGEEELQKASLHYKKLFELYTTEIEDRQARAENLVKKIEEISEQYNNFKHLLISVENKRDSLTTTGAKLLKRWQKLSSPPKRKKESSSFLSTDERVSLREQANLYMSLAEEADKFAAEYEETERLTKEYKKSKSTAKAERKLLQAKIEEQREKLRLFKKEFSSFKGTRNGDFKLAGESTVNEEMEEEIIIFDTSPVKDDISETSEVELKVRSITEIEEKLRDGDFESLLSEYTSEHERFFIGSLIELYSKKDNESNIDLYAYDYIIYLLDEHSKEIAELYQLFLDPFIDSSTISGYLETLRPTLVISNLAEKILYLTRLAGFAEEKPTMLKTLYAFVYDGEILPQVIPKVVVEVDKNAMEVVIVPKEESIEQLRARVLFAPYTLKKERGLFSRGCTYPAKDRDNQSLSIRISPYSEEITEKEEAIHEILANHDGFARTFKIFHLAEFPLQIVKGGACQNIKNTESVSRWSVYVMEYPDESLTYLRREEYMRSKDKLCILAELLETLYSVKKQFGIQHNDITRHNIRFNYLDSVEKRVYAGSLRCSHEYQLRLVNLEFASMDLDMSPVYRELLSHNDFHSFTRLALHAKISPSFTKSINTIMADGAIAVPFIVLFDIIRKEQESKRNVK